MLNIIKKILGTKNEREIKRYRSLVTQINALEPEIKALSDEQLSHKTIEFRKRLADGALLDSLLVEAFAVVREASVRTLKMRHFDSQLIGGMALHEGRISEMKTGEGKTLTATLAVYLNALPGLGVHVITVNDYLANRDSEWMGKIYTFLGMTVGLIVHGLSDEERRASYASDVAYGTNNEFGFDYLRDNMKTDLSRYVQRSHNFCIVDEVDSILIDEARTPLIISGPADISTELYAKANAAIPGLHKDSDYIIDEKSRTVTLTDDGVSKLEQRLRVDNLYDPKNIEMLHHVQQSLKAHMIFKKDVDYVVKDGKIIIVDEFTGRLMHGRRYSDGLHAALEAKEHVKIERETQVLATITFQNYFRLYAKLSGMTGTADTEAVEFKKIYSLEVVVIPTHKTCVRKDDEDEIYRTASEKFNIIADEISTAQKNGQPVLVGTVSVEKSELLSSLLKKRNIPHEILNAKNHSREAAIIAQAGHKGNVTISTNMAGRGTDIVLGPGVADVGGLFVIGTERHESRRIDNQLRGRGGRQGDPGRSKFFLSLEDDLMRIFASDRLSAIMQRLGMKEGEAIVSPMVTRAIERAQRRVEEQNFASRKHVLEYDDVMNQQRQVIYAKRLATLKGTSELEFMPASLEGLVGTLTTKYAPEITGNNIWPKDELLSEVSAEFNMPITLENINWEEISTNTLVEMFSEKITAFYQEKKQSVGNEIMKKVEAFIYLQIIDQTWKEHLRHIDQIQESVRLKGYGQRDPLQEYKKSAFKAFEEMMVKIEDETTLALLRMPPPQLSTAENLEVEEPDEDEMNFAHPDAGSSFKQPVSATPGQNTQSGARDEDKMIYHGHREVPPQKNETFVRNNDKVGRNDPCPCGSGKKYKKCHGKPADEE